MTSKTAATLSPDDFRAWLDQQEPARIIAIADTATESPLTTFATEVLAQRTFITIDGVASSFEGRIAAPPSDWMLRFLLYFDASLLTRATVKQVSAILDRACPRAAQAA